MVENYNTEYSYDGYEIYKIKRDEKLLYLGSKYNMKNEIETLQKKIKQISDLNAIVIFGSVNGAWLEELDAVMTDKKILIVEPEKFLAEKLKNREYNVYKNEIKLLCMEDEDLYNNLLSVIKVSNIKCFVFSNYDFIYKEKFDELIDNLKHVASDVRIRENTSNYFSKIWFKNYLENIPYLFEADSINSYRNMYKNKPAIIVSSGPSLDKNLKLLKGQEDKFIVIAVGRSLKAMEDVGVKCDFTAVIDGEDVMYKIFEQSLHSKIPLLFNEQSSSEIIKRYSGEKIFFSTREFLPADEHILEVSPITLFQGGSVAHACVDFARVLGCDTIIFIGQDLAYTDDKTHANNSKAGFENNVFVDETNLYVKGVKKEIVKTSAEFNIFRSRLEMMIKLYTNIRFINATEGGAHIEGTIEKDLGDVLNEYNKRIDKTKKNESFNEWIFRDVVLENLREIYMDLNNTINLCNKARRISRNLPNSYVINNNLYCEMMNKLDNIDVKIRKNSKINYLFETVIISINNCYANNFNFDEKSITTREKIKLHSQKSEFLYNELSKAFEYGKPLIKDCINKLEAR